MKAITNRHLVRFFGITFAFSWFLWTPSVLKSNGFPDLPDIAKLPGTFATFGPAIAAFWLTWRQSGKEGAKKLWLRGWRLNFQKKWLIPALLFGPIVALLTAALVLLLGGEIPWGTILPSPFIAPIFLLIFITQGLPEEYGWRGYALDPLQSRFSALTASLILGAIWALWHLPLFFIEGTTQEVIPLYEFVLQHSFH